MKSTSRGPYVTPRLYAQDCMDIEECIENTLHELGNQRGQIWGLIGQMEGEELEDAQASLEQTDTTMKRLRKLRNRMRGKLNLLTPEDDNG